MLYSGNLSTTPDQRSAVMRCRLSEVSEGTFLAPTLNQRFMGIQSDFQNRFKKQWQPLCDFLKLHFKSSGGSVQIYPVFSIIRQKPISEKVIPRTMSAEADGK